jgi:uncharacterized protein
LQLQERQLKMDYKNLAEKNKILEIRVGSHLFGTDTPDSDLDLYGIFMPFDEIVYGMHKYEEVKSDIISKDSTGRNTKDAVDRTITEYRKFIRLALQNNPNILHTLFVDKKNILHLDEGGFGQRLLDMAERFPYKGAHHRFVKYADSQRYKMRIKPENFNALENGLKLLEQFGDNTVIAEVAYDKFNTNFKVTTVSGGYDIHAYFSPPFVDNGNGKHIKCGDLNFERGLYVKRVRNMIKDRLSKATSRKELFTRYGYDSKFASNLIHLLMEGIELMKTGRIEYPLTYANHILDIKKGKYSVEEILDWADELVEESRDALNNTKLPDEPRTKEIEEFAMNEVRNFLKG